MCLLWLVNLCSNFSNLHCLYPPLPVGSPESQPCLPFQNTNHCLQWFPAGQSLPTSAWCHRPVAVWSNPPFLNSSLQTHIFPPQLCLGHSPASSSYRAPMAYSINSCLRWHLRPMVSGPHTSPSFTVCYSFPSLYFTPKHKSTYSTWNPMLGHHSSALHTLLSLTRILFSSHPFGKLFNRLQTSLKCLYFCDTVCPELCLVCFSTTLHLCLSYNDFSQFFFFFFFVIHWPLLMSSLLEV